tara:strand:+ start:151 stop:642 length:492 start_codon:yes stop_codon:yes gene_type:complete
MGSQPSKHPVLTCPTNFDKQQFKKICTLFDKFDKYSNFDVPSDEIEDIAALHVKNCILRIHGKIQAKSKAFKFSKKQITIDEKNTIAKVKQDFDMCRQQEKLALHAAIQSLENRMATYEDLDENGKADAFMKAVMPSGETRMDFWSFFEYMKTKTDDNSNIGI